MLIVIFSILHNSIATQLSPATVHIETGGSYDFPQIEVRSEWLAAMLPSLPLPPSIATIHHCCHQKLLPPPYHSLHSYPILITIPPTKLRQIFRAGAGIIHHGNGCSSGTCYIGLAGMALISFGEGGLAPPSMAVAWPRQWQGSGKTEASELCHPYCAFPPVYHRYNGKKC